MNELNIEYISINELKPFEKNAKLHPAEQVEQIANSIEQFGMNDPIAIWKNGEVIEGHGRLLACKKLGIKEVPVIRLDSLSDGERRAYMLAHNKTTMNSDFDAELLNLELTDLTELDFDMTAFGFDVLSLDDLGEEFSLPDGDKAPYKQITFTLANEQADAVMEILDHMKKQPEYKSYDNYGNDNGNGNALYAVVREWDRLKTSL